MFDAGQGAPHDGGERSGAPPGVTWYQAVVRAAFPLSQSATDVSDAITYLTSERERRQEEALRRVGATVRSALTSGTWHQVKEVADEQSRALAIRGYLITAR